MCFICDLGHIAIKYYNREAHWHTCKVYETNHSQREQGRW